MARREGGGADRRAHVMLNDAQHPGFRAPRLDASRESSLALGMTPVRGLLIVREFWGSE